MSKPLTVWITINCGKFGKMVMVSEGANPPALTCLQGCYLSSKSSLSLSPPSLQSLLKEKKASIDTVPPATTPSAPSEPKKEPKKQEEKATETSTKNAGP